LTRQRYVSHVTRAGDIGRSEGFALDALKSAQFCRLAALAHSNFARDRPDSVARSAVPAAGWAAAQLRLVGACDLDPARHQKYDVPNMQLYHSLTVEATEPCLGECPELRKEEPLPRRSGVSRTHERCASVFRGPPGAVSRQAVNHEAVNHEAFNHKLLAHESLGAKAPARNHEVAVTIDREAHSSKRSALSHSDCHSQSHSLPRHPPLPRGVL